MINLKIGNLLLNSGTAAWVDNFTPGSDSSRVPVIGARIDLNLLGTRTDIETTITYINQALEQARLSQADPAVDRVYLDGTTDPTVTTIGDPKWRRSEIVDGVLEVDTDYYNRLEWNHVPATLLITRRNWWESAEVTIPLTNGNGTQVTTPLRVYNANDGSGTSPNKRVNYADIYANVIQGDMPTPVTLSVTNLHTANLGGLWIGMNSTRPTFLSGHSLEAEAASYNAGTTTAHASASGGSFVSGSMAFGTEAQILGWTVPAATISAMRGQRVRMLMRPWYTGSYSTFRYAVKLVSGVTVLWESGWIRETAQYARHWLDMFDFRLPPWLEGLTGLDAVTLQLWATPVQAGTWTWAFDDFLLLSQDGFVQIDTITQPNGKVIIQGSGYAWSELSGVKTGVQKFVGSLYLTPAKFHRFYFALHESTANSAPITQVVGVQASYRPRRLTL